MMPMHHSLRSSRGDLVRRLVERLVEDELGHAVAVAQIDEHAPAVVAVRLDPTGQDDVLADVAGAQRPQLWVRVCVARNALMGRGTLAGIRAEPRCDPAPTSGFPSSCDRIRSLERSGI